MSDVRLYCVEVRTTEWARLVTKEYSMQQAGQALKDMEKLAVVKALIRPDGSR